MGGGGGRQKSCMIKLHKRHVWKTYEFGEMRTTPRNRSTKRRRAFGGDTTSALKIMEQDRDGAICDGRDHNLTTHVGRTPSAEGTIESPMDTKEIEDDYL